MQQIIGLMNGYMPTMNYLQFYALRNDIGTYLLKILFCDKQMMWFFSFPFSSLDRFRIISIIFYNARLYSRE